MDENSGDASLILFARFPRPGKVKTRLASSLGHELAAEFYKLCAEHIFQESVKLSGRIRHYLFYSDLDDSDDIKRWAGSKFHFVPQIEGDLGERMEHAFDTVFFHDTRKAVIIGTDVPDLSSNIIEDAFHILDSCDIVVGPSRDGGYYLLGMKELYKEIFADMPWSTDQVFKRTLNRIRGLGLTVHLLPTLSDIDTEEDLRFWADTLTADARHPIQDFVRKLRL